MYIIYLIILALIIMMLIFNKHHCKLNNKLVKVFTLLYVTITFFTIFLPDGFIKSVDDPLELVEYNKWHAILRVLLAVNPIIAIVAVFFDNKTFQKILVYYSLPITFLSTFFYSDFIYYYLDSSGKGLLKIDGISQNFKDLLLNETFRGVILSVQWILMISICLKVLLIDKPYQGKPSIKNLINGGCILVCLLLQMMPIYVPQIIFEGYGPFLFDKFTPLHFIWIFYIIVKIIILWFLFRNQSDENKYILCLVLAISVLFQYNQMFSLTINIKRLPLQLCNLASYLMLIALIFKNKVIFNFNFLVNVVGAVMAILVPDVKGYNIFEIWNLHFIYEHTNVVVVPILSLILGVFDKINLKSYRDAVAGFSIYFVIVTIIGSIFNHLAVVLDKSSFKANYMFMFNPDVATSTLPFLQLFVKYSVRVGEATLYPFLMMFAYIGYLLIVTIVFIPFYLKYKKTKQVSN